MKLYQLFYKLGFTGLSKRRVKYWCRTQNADNLIFALENGIYSVRALAAKCLGDLLDPKAIPALRKGIDDKVKMVSVACMDAAMKVSNSSEIAKEIKDKMEEWKVKEQDSKIESYQGHYYSAKWKKRDWLEIVRQQLKKPMRWG
jgi:hypothetical protein